MVCQQKFRKIIIFAHAVTPWIPKEFAPIVVGVMTGKHATKWLFWSNKKSLLLVSRKDICMVIINPFQSKEVWVYDLEVYPNFFMALFTNGKDVVELFRGDEITKFVDDKNKILVGYNTLNYDDIIIKSIIQGKVKSVTDVYNLSRWVIDYDREDQNERSKFNKIRYTPFCWGRSADLSLFFQDDESGRAKSSLKEMAVRLGWSKIQDLPYDFDKPITPDQQTVVREYCRNDIGITIALWNKLYEHFVLRQELETKYGVDVFDKTNAQISETIILDQYSKSTNYSIQDIKKLKTERDTIAVVDLIPSTIRFESELLQGVLAELNSIVLRKDEKGNFPSINKEIDIDGFIVSLMKGGIHSKDKANYFESCDTLQIIDKDVTSFYPNIMINFGLKPAHLMSAWTKVLTQLTEQRVVAKKAGEKVFADALKIVVNSAFGKSGNKHSFMHDPALLLSVTITGQLLILMLIEKINMAGIELLSANTDGVTVRIQNDQNDLFQGICASWEKETKFELEAVNYTKYVRQDVNNYIAITDKGKVKQKGSFSGGALFRKNDGAIIAKALRHYVENGIPVETTIRQEENILLFCYSYKATRAFSVLHDGQKAQKTNRFYVSKAGKSLNKKRLSGKGKVGALTLVSNGDSVTLCNDLPDALPNDIDYDHYIKKTKEILYRTLNPKRAELLRTKGLYSVPKQYKSNPTKSKLNEVQEWEFGDYHGIGAYTGDFVGLIALDIDKPEIFRRQELLAETLVIWHGDGGGYEQVSQGKKRGTLLYFCQDSDLRSTKKDFLDKHGFEVLFGGKPVQMLGMHTSLEDYQFEGHIAQIPEELHKWIIENTKKNGRRKQKKIDLTTGDLFTEEEEEVEFDEDIAKDPTITGKYKQLLKEFNLGDLTTYSKKRFAHHMRGWCPFSDSHSSKSNKTNFDIGIDSENKIRLGCFHVNCEHERKELSARMNLRWQELIAPEKRKAIKRELPKADTLLGQYLRTDEKFAIIESPTGSGKSYESAVRFLELISQEIPVIFAASNKLEMEQFRSYLLDIAKVKDIKEIHTQMIMREEINSNTKEDLDISVNDSTLGLVIHHGYLVRKGLSDRFYSVHLWFEKNKPVFYGDEGDGMIDKATFNLPMASRYSFRKSKGESVGRFFRRNLCPLSSNNGNCTNCKKTRAQTYETNDYHLFQIYDDSKIKDEDFQSGKLSSFEWPDLNVIKEVVLKQRIIAKQIEIHSTMIRQKDFKFFIKEDEEITFEKTIQDLIVCLDYPTIYTEHATWKDSGEIIHEPETVVDENNKLQVNAPTNPCEIPHLCGRDMGGFELLRRNCRQVIFLSARFSESKKSFLRKVYGEGLAEFKITESKQKIDELMVVNYTNNLNLIERHNKVKRMFYQEIATIEQEGGKKTKTIAFLPKKSVAEDVFKNIPKTEPTGFYKEDRVVVNEKYTEGQYSALISYSRGPLGRAINMAEYFLSLIDTQIFKPAVAYNLNELTPEEIDRQMQDDRLDHVYQNAGRIIRGSGRKAIILYNSDAEIANWLAQELEPMVINNIVRTNFSNKQDYPKSSVFKYLKFRKVDETDLDLFAERTQYVRGVSVSSTLSKQQRNELKISERLKCSKLETLIEEAKNWSEGWDSFRRKKHISRLLKNGKITEDDISALREVL